jgi:uroporphyrin-3 C-methyltransferase
VTEEQKDVATDPPEDAPRAAEDTPSAAQSEPAARGGGVVGWLALLLVAALGAAGGWYYLQAQQRETEQLRQLEDLQAGLAAMRSEADTDLDGFARRAELDARTATLEQHLVEGLQAVDQQLLVQQEALAAVQGALHEQGEELARFTVSDRRQWQVAEVQYLLRLANQRLIMAGDIEAAAALLDSADRILRQLEDPVMHPVRAAVSADLAALRAVPMVDTEGLYLRLAALIEQAGKLVIFRLPEPSAEAAPGPAQGWQERLARGYRAALDKLSEYIVVRRRDVPHEVLMDPQWEGLVRQNLRMLLEQAQVALLLGNQSLFEESLQRAGHWVGEFFVSDEAAARALAQELERLAQETVAVTLPDISRSLRALDQTGSGPLQGD